MAQETPLIQKPESPMKLKSQQSLSSVLPPSEESNSPPSPVPGKEIKPAKEESPWGVPFPLDQKIPTNQNSIRTAKYTFLTFFPLQIKFQFSKSYNLYFLVAALTVFTGFSSLSPINQILPLCIVFFFSAGKEAIEDYARYIN